MGKKYDVVAAIREEGRDKPRWVNCGAVIETAKGLSLKLESLPVGPGWNGWLSLFEPKAKDDKPTKPAASRPEPDDIDW